MNEKYAADPDCFGSSGDLKALLDKFGVFTGRYLVSYPDDWESRLDRLKSSASPVESSRISQLLRRAKESCGLIKMPSLIWMDHLSWCENAAKLTKHSPPKLDRLVVPNGAAKVPPKAIPFDDCDLPPTAEERVPSTPEEYLRAMKMLLLISHELILVDPYLNPCNRFVSPVLTSLLTVMAGTNSKCKTVYCYARTRDVLSDQTTLADIKSALKYTLSSLINDKPLKIIFNLVDDYTSTDRMHDRYMLSVKGGIQLSQGFQTQRRNAKVTVSPMSPSLHKDIWSIYMERRTDMRIEHTIAFP